MKPISTHERPTRPAGPSTSKKGPLPTGASAGSGRCQVQIGTDSPCGRPAATEVLSVLFCERCAREQEDYFAIGELTRVPRGREAGTTSPVHRPQAPTGRRRRLRDAVATGGRGPLLLVVLIFSALASAACDGTEQARAESAATDAKAVQTRDAEEPPQTAKASVGGNGTDLAVARAGDARAGTDGAEAQAGSVAVAGNVRKDVQKGDVEKKDGPRKVTLWIKGDPGTRFSGACSVGGKERALDGRTPERYAFGPRGKKLECEVRKEGEGVLEIVFADGEGTRSVQRTGAGESTVGFVYSGGGLSSSTSSVSVDRTVTSSGGSSPDGSP